MKPSTRFGKLLLLTVSLLTTLSSVDASAKRTYWSQHVKIGGSEVVESFSFNEKLKKMSAVAEVTLRGGERHDFEASVAVVNDDWVFEFQADGKNLEVGTIDDVLARTSKLARGSESASAFREGPKSGPRRANSASSSAESTCGESPIDPCVDEPFVVPVVSDDEICGPDPEMLCLDSPWDDQICPPPDGTCTESPEELLAPYAAPVWNIIQGLLPTTPNSWGGCLACAASWVLEGAIIGACLGVTTTGTGIACGLVVAGGDDVRNDACENADCFSDPFLFCANEIYLDAEPPALFAIWAVTTCGETADIMMMPIRIKHLETGVTYTLGGAYPCANSTYCRNDWVAISAPDGCWQANYDAYYTKPGTNRAGWGHAESNTYCFGIPPDLPI